MDEAGVNSSSTEASTMMTKIQKLENTNVWFLLRGASDVQFLLFYLTFEWFMQHRAFLFSVFLISVIAAPLTWNFTLKGIMHRFNWDSYIWSVHHLEVLYDMALLFFDYMFSEGVWIDPHFTYICHCMSLFSPCVWKVGPCNNGHY